MLRVISSKAALVGIGMDLGYVGEALCSAEQTGKEERGGMTKHIEPQKWDLRQPRPTIPTLFDPSTEFQGF